MQGQPFVISAPSGTGKSTITDALINSVDGLGYSISHTSRRPRATEKDGIDYHFVDRDTFCSMIDRGAFIEWAEVYDDLYGTSFSGLDLQIASGLDILLDIDIQGARNIRRDFEKSVLIYILPPSLNVLRERLEGRGTDSEEAIGRRLKKASIEVKNCIWYDYIVINDDLERAIGEVRSIILAERCRSARRAPGLPSDFGISYE